MIKIGSGLVFAVLSLLFTAHAVKSQNAIEIASINGNDFTLTISGAALAKAAYWTFKDDSNYLSNIRIKQFGLKYFLAFTVENEKREKKLVAARLDILGTKFVLSQVSELKTCSNPACDNCSFLIDNNKIAGCKCEQNGTVSNHCHYNSQPANAFFKYLKRAMKQD